MFLGEIITDICFSHCQYCFRTFNLTGFQNSNLKSTIERAITKYNLIESGDKIVLGVSGGPDSISMLNIIL